MNRVLSEIKDIESAIRQSRDGVQSYLNAKETLAQAESRIRTIEEALPELRAQTAKLQGAYELREWWLKREMLLAEDAEIRSKLSDPTAPLLDENAKSAWEQTKKQRDEAHGNLSAIQKELSEVRSLRERLIWDEALLASYPELERLESAREAVIAKREERAELEAERRTLDESVRHILSRLSGQWGEAELLAFGSSAADREEARKLQQSWEQEERASVSLQSELRRFARQIEVLETERDFSQSLAPDESILSPSVGSDLPFGPFVPRTKPALLQAWHNVEDARREFERARSTLRPSRPKYSRVHKNAGQAGKANGNSPRYVIAGVLGVTAVAMPFLLNEEGDIPFLAYAISVCLLLLSASIAIMVSRRRADNEDRSATQQDIAESEQYITSVRIHQKQLNDKLRQLLEHAETAAAELVPVLPETDSDDAAISYGDTFDAVWQQLRGAVHGQLEQLEERNRAQSKQQELQERVQELRMERDLVEKDSLEISKRLDVLRLNWQEWLNSRRLPLHLKPDSMPELFGIAEQGQAALRQLRRVTERSRMLLRTIQEFEQAASAVIAAYPPPAGVRTDAAQAVQWLYRDAVKQLAAKEEADRLDRRLVAAEASAEEARYEADRIGTIIAELFGEAGVETESDWEHSSAWMNAALRSAGKLARFSLGSSPAGIATSKNNCTSCSIPTTMSLSLRCLTSVNAR
ncbi:hypothetical protein [Cohnella cholangitidis]|uniref:Uncharacterized protein n=1 Tax=Cohnella cholangitidis TaxID=2598458 RepID=A0A7G5C3X1_9BACL|nr:hypothetical protein [Cohnella cholangitidis]QMV43905.1 hypothetical protein FPL14_24065 [Cohnella cholangitidis]